VTPETLVEQGKMQLMKQEYTNLLLQQIATRKALMPEEQIKTIYVGGGTPFQLGKENLIQVIETIFSTRDCSSLEELSIELNPDPIDETLLFVEQVTQRWKDVFRLRFSIGIQSFDDAVLTESKRAYTYANLPDFFRKLQKIKGGNVCYNADFIAFGDRSGMTAKDATYLPRGEEQRTFFEKLVSSQMIDGFSIYTLELFPWSDRYNKQLVESKQEGASQEDKDTVYDEFDRLATVVETNGYRRYELSNFAIAGKRSIHNMVYWTMGSYLGLGINASSLLTNATLQSSPLAAEKLLGKTVDQDCLGVRFSVGDQRKAMQAGEVIDSSTIDLLDPHTWLRDELMLKLRTDQRIVSWEPYLPILEKNRQDQIDKRVAEGWMNYDEGFWRQMSSYGLDLYNALITDLMVFAEPKK
jgi:coproporphyrinogen III oxidase-like Fe-S oxidoreductase